MEFKNKQKKGWILEEIEKKTECLESKDFGGEEPEDVEKHQEEVNKEINKRLDGAKKVAKKVVGQDFEEHAKPHKVEVYYVGRKDLGEAIGKLKEQNINYSIKRSPKEGFRYVVEYFSDEHKKDEPLLEKIDLDEEDAQEGFISGAEELSHDELANLEKSLWDKLGENEIHPEDGTFSNSSNRLADLDLYMLINGDWKHDHLFAEHLVEEWCKENGYVIIKHTSEEIGDSDRDDYEAEHHWFLVKDTNGKVADTVNTLHQMFTSPEDSNSEDVDESLKEENDSIKYVVCSFEDLNDKENDYSICIKAIKVPSKKEAEEFLSKDREKLNLGKCLDVREVDSKEAHYDYDMTNEKSFPIFGESLKEGVETRMYAVYSDKDEGPTMDEIKGAINEIDSKIEDVKEQGDGCYSVYFKASKDNLFKVLDSLGIPYEDDSEYIVNEVLDDEDLPDAIPDEPIVVSTEPGDDVAAVVEEPTEEVKKAGLYNALSSELRDTLQDIENLKSLTVTFVEEGREDLIDDLNAIMDERTIHSGMLQQLMTRVEGKVEAEETNTEPVKEESLKEDVAKREYSDEEIERAKKFQASSLRDGGEEGEAKEVEQMSNSEFVSEFLDALGTEGFDELINMSKNESLKEEWQYCDCKDLDEVEMLSNYCNKNNCEITAKTSTNDGYKCRIEGPFDDVHKVRSKWTDFKWRGTPLEESLEEAKEETIHLDKYEIDDNDSAEQKEDAKIMPYGEVTKSQWEDFLSKAKWPYWLAWENLKNEVEHKD